MITAEKLIEAGYKEWFSPMLKEDDKRAFQKCIKNHQNQKRYFINVYYWNIINMFSSEVVFYLSNDCVDYFRCEFNISEKTTIQELELFFAKVFLKMDCWIDAINN